MADTPKVATDEDGRNPSWEEKRREARGWFGPSRLAERRRRREKGEPLLQLVDEDRDREEAA